MKTGEHNNNYKEDFKKIEVLANKEGEEKALEVLRAMRDTKPKWV